MRNVLEQPPAPPRAMRRLILKARKYGHRYGMLLTMASWYLEESTDPLRARMTAPASAARTKLAKLVDLWSEAPSCAGNCNQGRRACDCRKP